MCFLEKWSFRKEEGPRQNLEKIHISQRNAEKSTKRRD